MIHSIMFNAYFQRTDTFILETFFCYNNSYDVFRYQRKESNIIHRKIPCFLLFLNTSTQNLNNKNNIDLFFARLFSKLNFSYSERKSQTLWLVVNGILLKWTRKQINKHDDVWISQKTGCWCARCGASRINWQNKINENQPELNYCSWISFSL